MRPSDQTDSRDPQLERLIGSTLEELEVELSHLLDGRGLGPIGSPDPGAGRAWIERNVEALRNMVCSDPTVVAVVDPADNSLAEAAAVADCLAATFGWPVGATIAAIIVKRGLHAFCSRG